MRKTIWYTCIGVLFYSQALSQARFGFKGGLGVAGFIPGSYRDASINQFGLPTRRLEDKFVFNYQVGLATQVPVSKDQRFSLFIELYYSAQGNRVEYSNLRRQLVVMQYRLGYIRLPLLVRYQIINGLYVNAGPEVAYRMVVSGNQSIGENISADLREDHFTALNSSSNNVHIFNTYEVAVVGGVGYQVFDKIFIELRYNYGLNSVYNNDVVSTYFPSPIGNHTSHIASCSFFYLF